MTEPIGAAAFSKPQMHFSALEVLWQCGIKFEFRYIKKLRVGGTSYLHVGKAVDHAANLNLQNKIDTNVLLPIDQVVDEARDSVVHSMDADGLTMEPEESILGERAVKAAIVDKTVRLTRAHALVLAPRLKPKRVQAKWSLEIPGMPFDLVGTRDLDEIDESLSDLKTSKKTPNPNVAETSDQLTSYALSRFIIDKIPPPLKVGLDYLVDLKTGVRVMPRLSSTRDRSDFQVLLRRLENASEILQKGAFTPANQGRDWWCSLTYCEYAPQCPFFRMYLPTPEGE